MRGSCSWAAAGRALARLARVPCNTGMLRATDGANGAAADVTLQRHAGSSVVKCQLCNHGTCHQPLYHLSCLQAAEAAKQASRRR